MSGAWAVELLKLRRAIVVWIATPVLTLVVPFASIGAVALARSPDVPGAAGEKFAPYATGPLAQAHLEVCGQVLAVAVLAVGGFAAAWCYAREFVDGTAGALFGLAVQRRTLGLAKMLVLAVWLVLCVLAAIAVTALLTLALGGVIDAAAWSTLGVALGAGLLSVGLVLPFGWVATRTRSPLATVGVLIALVAVTQVVVLLGAGTWFPYAVPSLWTGAGGREAAAAIHAPALALTAAVAPAAAVSIRWAWGRLTNV